MDVHTDKADADADADAGDTYNSKVESAKKDNADGDADGDADDDGDGDADGDADGDDGDDDENDSKIRNSSSSEIAKTEDDGHSSIGIDINIDIDVIYQETFTPWFVPLLFIAAPFFYKYGIIIYKNKNTGEDKDGGTNMEMEEEQEQEQSRITFGYGMKGPAITAGSAGSWGLSALSLSYWTSNTVSLENIDRASITVGTASALDNLTTFGGWGIRFGRVANDSIRSSSKHSYTFTRAYNACNGLYCEFTELISIQEGSSRSASSSTSTGASGSDDFNDQVAPLLKGKRYRIVSTDAEKVASILRSGSKMVSP